MILKDKRPNKYYIACKFSAVEFDLTRGDQNTGEQITLYVSSFLFTRDELTIESLTTNKNDAVCFSSRLKTEAITEEIFDFDKKYFILKEQS